MPDINFVIAVTTAVANIYKIFARLPDFKFGLCATILPCVGNITGIHFQNDLLACTQSGITAKIKPGLIQIIDCNLIGSTAAI